MPEHLLALFPSLGDYHVTSPKEPRYNCFAWAAGRQDKWIEPHPDYYWPEDAPLDYGLSAFVAAFSSFGFEACPDGRLETDFVKVAIFVIDGTEVSHMARQLANGHWTSKIGEFEDIEHASLAELEGAEYGAVVAYMRRGT